MGSTKLCNSDATDLHFRQKFCSSHICINPAESLMQVQIQPLNRLQKEIFQTYRSEVSRFPRLDNESHSSFFPSFRDIFIRETAIKDLYLSRQNSVRVLPRLANENGLKDSSVHLMLSWQTVSIDFPYRGAYLEYPRRQPRPDLSKFSRSSGLRVQIPHSKALSSIWPVSPLPLQTQISFPVTFFLRAIFVSFLNAKRRIVCGIVNLNKI